MVFKFENVGDAFLRHSVLLVRQETIVFGKT